MLRSVASSVVARSRTMATTPATTTAIKATRCRINFSLSSSSFDRRTKTRGGAVPRTKIATAEAERLKAINLSSDPDEFAVIDNQVRMKNGIMAVSLAGFCFFVAWYSMYANGQAGNDE